jgi:hypothetical protein
MIGALLLLVVSVVPTGEEFTCTPKRVWDGDGPVWCKEGPVSGWLALLLGRLMIVAALTSRVRLPAVPKPAMPS